MQADKQGNVISLVIILIMVTISVLNTIMMSVMERQREIGILRAIGTRPWRIIKTVELETLLLNGVSLILGVALALPLNMYFANAGITLSEPFDVAGMKFEAIRGEISWVTMVMPGLFIIGATCIAALWPAWYIVSKTPLQAIRGRS